MLVGCEIDHLRIGLKAFQAEQSIMIGRLLTWRNSQPFVQRIKHETQMEGGKPEPISVFERTAHHGTDFTTAAIPWDFAAMVLPDLGRWCSTIHRSFHEAGAEA